MTPTRRIALVLGAAAALVLSVPAPAGPPAPLVGAAAAVSGDHVLLAWNDLGMHCMNKDHANFSVLPPYNNLDAQLVRRGDATRLPELVTQQVTVEYSFPGNTTTGAATGAAAGSYGGFGFVPTGSTTNNLYGFQAGGRFGIHRGRWGCEVFGKSGIYGNYH